MVCDTFTPFLNSNIESSAIEAKVVVQAIRTQEFWVLGVAFAVGIGSGVTLLQSVNLLVEAYDDTSTGDDGENDTASATAENHALMQRHSRTSSMNLRVEAPPL